MIYVLYFTFWLTSGSIVHSSLEAHSSYKALNNKSSCEQLARETQTRLEKVCFPSRYCYRVEVECRHVNKKDYFSKRHYINRHSYRNDHEVENEIHKKRKRKSRSSKKSRLE